MAFYLILHNLVLPLTEHLSVFRSTVPSSLTKERKCWLFRSTNNASLMVLPFSSVLQVNTLKCVLYFCSSLSLFTTFIFIRRNLIIAIDIALLHTRKYKYDNYQHIPPIIYCSCLQTWSIYIVYTCLFFIFLRFGSLACFCSIQNEYWRKHLYIR